MECPPAVKYSANAARIIGEQKANCQDLFSLAFPSSTHRRFVREPRLDSPLCLLRDAFRGSKISPYATPIHHLVFAGLAYPLPLLQIARRARDGTVPG